MDKLNLRLIVCVIAVSAVLSLVACKAHDSDETQTEIPMQTEVIPTPEIIEPDGHQTSNVEQGSPEEAVAAFLSAFRNADLDRMIDTFVPDSDNDELVVDIAIQARRGVVAASIASYYTTLSYFDSGSTLEGLLDLRIVHLDGTASEFYSQLCDVVSSSKFGTLDLIGFVPLEELSQLGSAFGLEHDYTDMRFIESMTNQVRESMANTEHREVAFVNVVFEINSKPYLQIFELFESNGSWYIIGLDGLLSREITQALYLEYSLWGLFPLYHVSIYTGVDEKAISSLRDDIYEVIDRVEGFDAAGSSSISETSAVYEGIGTDTPEGAAKIYLEGLRDASLENMLSAFAIESVVEKRDTIADIDSFGAYTLSIGLPNLNDFATAMNVEMRNLNISTSVFYNYGFLCAFESGQDLLSEWVDMSGIYSNNSIGDIERMLSEKLSINNLGTLNILGFIYPENLSEFSEVLGGMETPDSFFSEQTQEMFVQRNKRIGADSRYHTLAVFEIDSNIYLLCFEMIEYSGKWYIYDVGGALASFLIITDQTRGLVPVSFIGDEYGFDAVRFRELITSIQND